MLFYSGKPVSIPTKARLLRFKRAPIRLPQLVVSTPLQLKLRSSIPQRIRELGGISFHSARCLKSSIKRSIGAHIFGYVLTLGQITPGFVNWITTLDVSPYIVMAGIILFYIVLGCFMDQLAIMILTVPVMVPAIVSLGFDPVWFGVVVVVTAEVVNTGEVWPVSQVVQVYVSRPAGKLPQPKYVLAGFARTAMLDPGQSQQVEANQER